MIVDVIIPALNEERSVPFVLRDIADNRVRRIVVVNNGSTDGTSRAAREHGAIVVDEPRAGYGSACLAGLYFMTADPPDVVAFLDADYSDFPNELGRILDALHTADLVIGSRTTGGSEAGALLPQARFGNWLATRLIQLRWGVRFTDLGPFRAVRWSALERINMQDRDFGWTVEMQVKAAALGLRCVEVPVSYRKRVGVSKITGTVRGSWLAGKKILYVIAREAMHSRRPGGTP
jgi:glycosyltransferase involved in cell wall biosynthesis